MKCDEVRETMPDLATGSMEPSEAMQEHLQKCATCATQLQEFRQTMALLDEWEAPEPSPYFDTRLQARLRGERRRKRHGDVGGWRGCLVRLWRWRRHWLWLRVPDCGNTVCVQTALQR